MRSYLPVDEALKGIAFARIKTHHPVYNLRRSTPKARYAEAGGTRNRAISDRVSENICRGTATSAIWKVT
jgi:hypothetical protein